MAQLVTPEPARDNMFAICSFFRHINPYGSAPLFSTGFGMTTDKTKAIETAVSQIERAFGKGAIMRLGGDQVVEVETVSTGSLGLDIALGVGGLPRGRIIEVYGPESSGKTTLALHTIAEAQKKGGV